MANRRCFSSKITESDEFFRLPTDAQALYLHLNMISDDDGFVNSAESATARIKNGKKSLSILVEKRFVLKFGSVYVIKHWRISNSLKNDRVKPLLYSEIAKKIWVKQNKAYTDHPEDGCITLYEIRTGLKPVWNPNGIQMESERNPNGILTEPNITKPNLTKPNLTADGGSVEQFEMVWREYPDSRKGNKESAYQAYIQVCQDSALSMLDSLRQWKQSEQWDKDDGKYIPYLVNWILRGIWMEKPDKMAIPKGASGELGDAELEAIRRVLSQPLEDVSGGDGLGELD